MKKPPAVPDAIQVGMAISLSGQFQIQGRQALQGASAWLDDTNTAGGVFVAEIGQKLPLRLIFYDDQSSAQKVRALTQHIIAGDGADLLLGPYSSGLTMAAAEVAERWGRVVWNHGGSADGIHRQGYRWSVGILTPASQYMTGTVDLLREVDPAASRVAILRSAIGSFSASVAEGVEAYARSLKLNIVYEGTFTSPMKDFLPLLRELERTSPELVIGVGRIQDDLLLAEQIDIGVARAIALVATPIDQFRRRLGKKADGFIGPSQWEASAPCAPSYGPSAEMVVRRFEALQPGEADYPMAQAYAGGLVAQRCIEEAGTLDNERLRQVANSLDFSTFYGRFKIDPDTGLQVGHSVVLVQRQGGEKVIVWPREMRQATLVYPIGSS